MTDAEKLKNQIMGRIEYVLVNPDKLCSLSTVPAWVEELWGMKVNETQVEDARTLGLALGYDGAAEIVLKHAQAQFRVGNDANAGLLRELSRALVAKARESRPETRP